MCPPHPGGACGFTRVIVTLTCLRGEGSCGLSARHEGPPKGERVTSTQSFNFLSHSQKKMQTSRK